MFPLLCKGIVQFLSIAKCPATIGKKICMRHLVLNVISRHYCLLFKDHSLQQTLSRKPTSRPRPPYEILTCCPTQMQEKKKKLKTRLSFCHLQYQAMFKVYRVTLVALQKAIMYSMKRSGPGRHKSLTQFLFFFFLYFNEFLFLYILHFFYVLTYEHVAKIQKKRREN